MSIFEKGKWIWISDKEVPDSYAEFYDMVIFGVFYIPSMNLPKAKGVRTVSLLFLTEKTQQQKVPTDQSNGLWELFYIGRRNGGERLPPGGRGTTKWWKELAELSVPPNFIVTHSPSVAFGASLRPGSQAQLAPRFG